MSKDRRSAPESAKGAALRMARLSSLARPAQPARSAAERHYLTRENKTHEQRKEQRQDQG